MINDGEGDNEIEVETETEKSRTKSKSKALNNKKAFEAGRNTMWSFDPLEVCIIGGECLPVEERGPLDTAVDKNHALWDPRLLETLDEAFVANINAFGVETPILIAKIEGVPTVVAGRRRIRAARTANRKRKDNGQPLMKVDAKQVRDPNENLSGLMGSMTQENEVRVDDNLMTKLYKAKKILATGVAEVDVALRFGMSLPHFKTLLSFDDNALNATKKAVESGKISPATAMTLARIKEPEKQKEALDEVLTHVAEGGRASPRVAKIAARAKGHKGKMGVTDKRTLTKLLEAVQSVPHPHNSSEKTLSWWEGVEDALKLVMGAEDVDAKLSKVLDEVYALMKTEAREKSKKK